jgi:hypothetical protein
MSAGVSEEHTVYTIRMSMISFVCVIHPKQLVSKEDQRTFKESVRTTGGKL